MNLNEIARKSFLSLYPFNFNTVSGRPKMLQEIDSSLSGINVANEDIQKFIDTTLTEILQEEVNHCKYAIYHEGICERFGIWVGIFLSTLIQNSTEEEMILNVESLPMQRYKPCINFNRPLEYLCSNLSKKKITIVANTGKF